MPDHRKYKGLRNHEQVGSSSNARAGRLQAILDPRLVVPFDRLARAAPARPAGDTKRQVDLETMTTEQALDFVAQHGIVLESARGPVPNLAEFIAGGPTHGSWWAHPKAHAIHAVTLAVRGSPEVLVCRLVNKRVTLVHSKLWPALVALAERLPLERLAAIREIHTAKGHHEVVETPFPDWVPDQVSEQATALDDRTAEIALGDLLEVIT